MAKRIYHIFNALYALALPIIAFCLVVCLHQEKTHLLASAFGFALFYATPAAIIMFIYNFVASPK